MYNKKVKEAAIRVTSSFQSLNKVVIGRSNIIRQMLYAVVTGQHLLLEGPPGVAKSHMVLQFFKVLSGCRTFKVQCTKKMTEDYLVGPLDMRLFREEGLFIHRTEGMLPDSHFAFIDEIMDLNSGALRALLEILNERTFTRGLQRIESPLHSAIATTNFNRDSEEELTAVLDRFLFRAKVEGLTQKADKRRMLIGYKNDTMEPVSWKDIRLLKNALTKVTISSDLLDLYLEMCAQLSLTDRTLKKALDVVRASAVLNGRTSAVLTDIMSLDTCFITTNDRTSEQRFAQATTPYHKHHKIRESKSSMVLLSHRITYLDRLAQDATEYESIAPVATEIREAMQAISHFMCSEAAKLAAPLTKTCEDILRKADELYAEETS